MVSTIYLTVHLLNGKREYVRITREFWNLTDLMLELRNVRLPPLSTPPSSGIEKNLMRGTPGTGTPGNAGVCPRFSPGFPRETPLVFLSGASLFPKSLHRINRCSPACRNKSSDSGADSECHNRAKICRGIITANAVKQACSEMSGIEGRGNAQTNANQNWPKSAAHHHRNDSGARSAHCHTNSDLAGTPGYEE